MARQGAAVTAVGFVNFMGYLGAFAGDQMTGWLKDRHVPLMFWVGCAFAAAASVACLWKTRAGDATGEESI